MDERYWMQINWFSREQSQPHVRFKKSSHSDFKTISFYSIHMQSYWSQTDVYQSNDNCTSYIFINKIIIVIFLLNSIVKINRFFALFFNVIKRIFRLCFSMQKIQNFLWIFNFSDGKFLQVFDLWNIFYNLVYFSLLFL